MNLNALHGDLEQERQRSVGYVEAQCQKMEAAGLERYQMVIELINNERNTLKVSNTDLQNQMSTIAAEQKQAVQDIQTIDEHIKNLNKNTAELQGQIMVLIKTQHSNMEVIEGLCRHGSDQALGKDPDQARESRQNLLIALDAALVECLSNYAETE